MPTKCVSLITRDYGIGLEWGGGIIVMEGRERRGEGGSCGGRNYSTSSIATVITTKQMNTSPV